MRSERGFATVFVALTMVLLLAAGAFALDLGQGYTSRRRMQNAADGASFAAARALMRTRATGVYVDPANTVWAAARDTALANGAAPLQASQCTVLRKDLTAIAPCSPAGGWVGAVTNGGPAGVRVTAAITNPSVFGKAIGASAVTARANANALIKPLASSFGSPFIICGNDASGTGAEKGYPMLDMATVPASIRPSAVGVSWKLQDSASPDCGAQVANFKGKTFDDTLAMAIGDWVRLSNGNGVDHGIYDTVAGAIACGATSFDNCDMVIPIADVGRTANGGQLRVAAFGIFHVVNGPTGNPKYLGKLLTATAPITRGVGGTGNCAWGAACVIKLVN